MSTENFTVGQRVVATGNLDCEKHLTIGKAYVVTKFEPESRLGPLFWPAYATVIGDQGKEVQVNAGRFAAKGSQG